MADRSSLLGISEHEPTIGWRCRPCGWQTFSLKVMHTQVNWRNPDNTIALVCPRCGTEGDFIDAYREVPTMDTITGENAEQLGDFGQYRKTALSKISNFTVPAGTTFRTPEGLYAEDEECRIAFDTQGGVYPIRESVFQESYEPA